MMSKAAMPYWPRAMRLGTAAAYVDLSTAEFLREVSVGVLPAGFRLGRSDHWDRLQIDKSIDRLTGFSDDWRTRSPLYAGVPHEESQRTSARAKTTLPASFDPGPPPVRAFKISTLASHWKCNEHLVRKLVQTGQLRAFRVGKLIRITPEAVEAYEAERKGENPTSSD